MYISLSVFFPIFAGIYLYFNKKDDGKKTLLYSCIIATCYTILMNIFGYNGSTTLLSLPLGMSISFEIDALSAMFSTLTVSIWLIVTIYAVKYMKTEEKRFYGFFIATLGAVLGVCYADNAMTLYMFFELMTIFSYVLIVHNKTSPCLFAGRKFLYISIFGASLGLLGMAYLAPLGASFELSGVALNSQNTNYIAFFTFLAVVGFGSKVGIYPLNTWVATSYSEAPTPGSAVLSGVITKAGVIAIIRIIYYMVGPELLRGTWAINALLALSILTIFEGSMLALREKTIKRRLAYSSMSQVCYVAFGLFLLNGAGLIGALLQVIFHSLTKTSLFLASGVITKISRSPYIEDFYGVGYKLRGTFFIFIVSSISLVGIPFTAGFVSKWYLGSGAFDVGGLGVLGTIVLMISAILTASYLLPIGIKAFFVEGERASKSERKIIMPIWILAILTVVFGIYPMPLINFFAGIVQSLGL